MSAMIASSRRSVLQSTYLATRRQGSTAYLSSFLTDPQNQIWSLDQRFGYPNGFGPPMNHRAAPRRSYNHAAMPSHDDNNNSKRREDPRELVVNMDELDSDSDDDDEEDGNQPWKTLLELPARASWRAADPRPPDAVVKAQANVLTKGAATHKQLRRTFADITASQRALAERRERERRRIVNGARYNRKAQLRDDEVQPVFYGRLETLASLRNRMYPNYSITKRVLEESKSLLGGNSATTWKPRRVIDMGIGVGSASAAALEVFPNDIEWIHGVDPSRCMRECATEFLEEVIQSSSQQQPQKDTRLTVSGSIATEASASTFDLALMSYTATELPHVASTLAAAAILWQKLSHNGLLVMIEPGTPDGFNSTRAVRNMLLDCCPPEPKQHDGEEEEDAPSTLEQCHILAPCTHNGKCPMERHQRHLAIPTQSDLPFDDKIVEEEEEDSDEEEDMWDSEFEELLQAQHNNHHSLDAEPSTHTVDRTDLLRGRFCSFVHTMSSGSHLSRGEKFSYLVAQKRIPGTGAEDGSEDVSSFQNDRLRDLLVSVYESNYSVAGSGDRAEVAAKQQRVQDLFEDAQALKARYLDSEEDDLGLELLQGDDNRSSFGRIIQAPLKKKGHVYIDYCAAPGRLMRTRVAKALDYGVAPGLYTAARKSRWGGLWPDVSGRSGVSKI